MVTRSRTYDQTIYRTYSKWILNSYGEPVLAIASTNVGPWFQKNQSGSDQVGGVQSVPRTRRLKDRKIPRGRRALDPHPYTMTLAEVVYSAHQIQHPSYGFIITTPVPHSAIWSYPDPDPSQEYKVIEKLRVKAYGSGWNPAVMAAEMPEAVDMIGSSAKRIRRGLICAALGDWRGIIKNLGEPTGAYAPGVKKAHIGFTEGRLTLSQFWLELQYGWKPLLDDIMSGCALIADALNGPGKMRNRVSARRSWQTVDSAFPAEKQICLCRRTCTFKLRYSIENLHSSPVFLPSLATVATVAWEKLPYSFVCDWVVPVGDYLAALRTASDLTGDVVRTLTRELTFDQLLGGPDTLPVPLDGDLGYSFNYVQVQRTVSTEISPPTPLGDLSPSSIFKSVTRAGNAIALLQNLRLPEGDRVGLKKLLRSG